jgi:uncharacterized membrane protein
MNKMFKKLAVISVTMLVIDLIMLSVLSKMWKESIEKIQSTPFKVKPLYAVGAYVLMIFGLYYFVLENTLPTNQLVIRAFAFGIVVYGIFDFTNLAIFTNYNLKTALIDILWGGILMASVTWLVQKIFFL